MLQHVQRLVAVRSDEHIIKPFYAMALSMYLDMVIMADDVLDRAVGAYPVFEASDKFFYVTVRTALDDIPLWSVINTEQAMVKEKIKEQPGREAEHVLRLCRPDSSAHGNDIFVDKYFAVLAVMQEVAEALIAVYVADRFSGFTVKAQDVRDHLVEHGSEQVTALGKQRVQVVAIIFKPGIFAFDAEAHLGFLYIDIEFFKQPDEVGVGPVVQYDKPGIYI